MNFKLQMKLRSFKNLSEVERRLSGCTSISEPAFGFSEGEVKSLLKRILDKEFILSDFNGSDEASSFALEIFELPQRLLAALRDEYFLFSEGDLTIGRQYYDELMKEEYDDDDPALDLGRYDDNKSFRFICDYIIPEPIFGFCSLAIKPVCSATEEEKRMAGISEEFLRGHEEEIKKGGALMKAEPEMKAILSGLFPEMETDYVHMADLDGIEYCVVHTLVDKIPLKEYQELLFKHGLLAISEVLYCRQFIFSNSRSFVADKPVEDYPCLIMDKIMDLII